MPPPKPSQQILQSRGENSTDITVVVSFWRECTRGEKKRFEILGRQKRWAQRQVGHLYIHSKKQIYRDCPFRRRILKDPRAILPRFLCFAERDQAFPFASTRPRRPKVVGAEVRCEKRVHGSRLIACLIIQRVLRVIFRVQGVVKASLKHRDCVGHLFGVAIHDELVQHLICR